MTEETTPAQAAGNAGGADAARPAQSASSRPLPPGLDLLWGRRGRGQRGPKPGLSIDAIVAAAIGLADAEGLEHEPLQRRTKNVAHELRRDAGKEP